MGNMSTKNTILDTSDGNVPVTLSTTISGEDQTNNVLVTQNGEFTAYYNGQTGWTDVAGPSVGYDYIEKLIFTTNGNVVNAGQNAAHLITSTIVIVDGGSGGTPVCYLTAAHYQPMIVDLNIKSTLAGGLAFRTTSADDYVTIIGRTL